MTRAVSAAKRNKLRRAARRNSRNWRGANAQRLLSLLLLFLTSVLTSCGTAPGTEAWFQGEASALRAKTVPPDCAAFAEKGIARESARIVAHWECDSSWDSARYRDWVKEQLRSGYKTIRSDADSLVVGKNLGGDFESIRVETRQEGGTLHIRIEVQSYPD